jgi:hypothetical protein
MDNIREMISQCMTDSEDMFPATANDLSYHTISLAGEVGEFSNLLKKVMRGSVTMEDVYPELRSELVDVLIYVCTIAGLLRVDLGVEYDIKRGTNVRRFTMDAGAGGTDSSADGEG